ncbi:hypothetical protein B484DRAFT_402043 [Ochromonadaceae sp. CCMP2298]|nr:hypothetical protein B484DRAFT_402043 [Ochromonadaceae sp. CCMP2298]
MPQPRTILLNADTGANAHFIIAADTLALTDLHPANQGAVSVLLPDGTTATSSHVGTLPIPRLSPEAIRAHVMDTFTGTLLSVGEICAADHDVTATFDYREVRIERGPELLLRGDRNPSTRVPQQPILSVSPVITHQSHADLVRYYYTALGCPVWSTFIDALASGILNIPHPE